MRVSPFLSLITYVFNEPNKCPLHFFKLLETRLPSPTFLSQPLICVMTHITDFSNLASYLHLEGPLEKIEKSAIDLLAHGHPEQAAPLFAVAAFLQGQKPDPWFHLAFCLYQQEDYTLAYSAVAAAQALRPAQPEYSILMAACLAAENNIEQAKMLIEQVQNFLDEHHLHLTEDWKGLHEGLRKILL